MKLDFHFCHHNKAKSRHSSWNMGIKRQSKYIAKLVHSWRHPKSRTSIRKTVLLRIQSLRYQHSVSSRYLHIFRMLPVSFKLCLLLNIPWTVFIVEICWKPFYIAELNNNANDDDNKTIYFLCLSQFLQFPFKLMLIFAISILIFRISCEAWGMEFFV